MAKCYIYCDSSTKKITISTKNRLNDDARGSRVEIEKESTHPAIKNSHLWQLNSSGDDLELCSYNFVDQDKKLCAIVEVLLEEITKKIPVFPNAEDIKAKIQTRYEEL